ncbi:MAG: hypothetical protein N3C60_04000 [Calditerrivibrio sp.]|nr:hypothetical protein [Calditerrivibrio sp.]
MVIGDGGPIINLKDRLQKLEKKESPSKHSSEGAKSSSEGSVKKTDLSLINFLKVREENILASKSGFIRDQKEAYRYIDELKTLIDKDISKAINAHRKADPNKVLRFYPFE